MNNTSDNVGSNIEEEPPDDAGSQQKPTSELVGIQHWIDVLHPYHGFSFANPCFCLVDCTFSVLA